MNDEGVPNKTCCMNIFENTPNVKKGVYTLIPPSTTIRGQGGGTFSQLKGDQNRIVYLSWLLCKLSCSNGVTSVIKEMSELGSHDSVSDSD